MHKLDISHNISLSSRRGVWTCGIDPDAAPGEDDGCFIANAAYGTQMAGEMDVLCQFRDEYPATEEAAKASLSQH
jgi:hypothetical protein